MHWGGDDIHVERHNIEYYHLEVLRSAVLDCMEFDVETKELRKALVFLEGKCRKPGVFNLFKKGLVEKNFWLLYEGYLKICRHLGEQGYVLNIHDFDV